MAIEQLDEVGPIHYLVIEFPGNEFNGDIAPTVLELVDRNIVRVLGLLIITKEADGSCDAIALASVGEPELGDGRGPGGDRGELLSKDDIVVAAADLAPGCTAALIVYENRWAAPFAAAVRKVGGQIVTEGRLPPTAPLSRPRAWTSKVKAAGPTVLASRPMRSVTRARAIRAAALVGTAALVVRQISRRQSRGQSRGQSRRAPRR